MAQLQSSGGGHREQPDTRVEIGDAAGRSLVRHVRHEISKQITIALKERPHMPAQRERPIADGDLVLIKASRGIGLDKIVTMLTSEKAEAVR